MKEIELNFSQEFHLRDGKVEQVKKKLLKLALRLEMWLKHIEGYFLLA